MLFSALSFATMGAFAHALREEVSWEVIALARSFVVLLLSGGILFVSGVPLHFRGPWQLWVRSICGSIGMLFIFFSLTRLPVAIVITLINLAPAWVAIASWFLMPEARGKSTWIAVAVGFVGVFLIQQPELVQGNRAVLAPLIASLLLAVVMMALHRAKDVDSRAVVLHFAMTACVTSLCVFLFSVWRTSLHMSFQPGVVFMLVATGVAATLGQLFLTIAFASLRHLETAGYVKIVKQGRSNKVSLTLKGRSFAKVLNNHLQTKDEDETVQDSKDHKTRL
ncbi:MAG: DMT family transporter [Pirellulaceae bacterium]